MIENVARANLIDELALTINQFLTHRIERDTLACDLTQGELTELATGLAAIAAMTVHAEPVAWMYEHHEFGCEIHTDRWGADTGGTSDDYVGWNETPLYAHPPVPQWRGIESAPRDGTDIYVIRADRWLQPVPAYYLSAEYLEREYGDPEYMETGWYPSNGFLFDLPEVTMEPTHWMPFPTPPAGGSDAE